MNAPVPSLLDRLKQRKLVQWALAYLAGAWLLLQLLDVLEDPLGLTPAFDRVVLVVAAMGFLATLTLAWFHGEKGRQRLGGVEVLILALVLLAGGATLKLLPQSDGPLDATEDARGDGIPNDLSVAVLPFENRSAVEEDAYFVGGVQDEILTRLARIGAIRVLPRTSVMEFRDRPEDLTEIARQLGVHYILEGGLLRAEGTVRINVHLFDAARSESVWADTYDRELSARNLLDVQSDITETLARTIDAEISPSERTAIQDRPTEDLLAYDLYLLGKGYLYPGSLGQPQGEPAERAAVALDQAIGRDSTFVQAVAWGAIAHLYAGNAPGEHWRQAEHLVERALTLDPELPEVLLANATLNYRMKRDYAATLEILDAVGGLLPEEPWPLIIRAYSLLRSGRTDEAAAAAEYAIESHSRHTATLDNMGHVLLYARRYDRARGVFERMASLESACCALHSSDVLLHGEGDLAAFGALVEAMGSMPWDFGQGLTRVSWYRAFINGDARAAAAVLEGVEGTVLGGALGTTQTADRAPVPLLLGISERWTGDPARASQFFDSALTMVRAERDRAHRVAFRSPDPRVAMLHVLEGWIHAASFRPEQAGASAEEAQRLADQLTPKAPLAAGWTRLGLFYLYAMAGRPDEALGELEAYMELPGWASPRGISLDPRAEAVRDHPRFQALLERYSPPN